MSLELDRLDHVGAQAFEGFVVRKNLVRRYAKSYPVPGYVVEFLLGRYCASTNAEEIKEECRQNSSVIPREVERLRAYQRDEAGHGHELFARETSLDTVGAVALDRSGNIAAATSTGGTLNKAPGRLGDSSLIGCGCYADNLSAAV